MARIAFTVHPRRPEADALADRAVAWLASGATRPCGPATPAARWTSPASTSW